MADQMFWKKLGGIAVLVLMSDLTDAVRSFRTRPMLAALIIVVLGMGLATNATMFTVVNGLLLRPLPYAAPDRVIEISQIPRDVTVADLGRVHSVQQVAGFTVLNQPIGAAGDAAPVLGMRASLNLFEVLGVKAVLGRVFDPERDDAASSVVVISYAYWQQISGDRSVIGKTLTIASQERAIIGILPPDFVLTTRDANFWIPDNLPQSRVVARLAPGASLAATEAELQTLARNINPSNGTVLRADQIHATPVSQSFRAGTQDRETVLLLQAAVGFILLITSANVASLLLIWSHARRREFAIRTAMGAGRTQMLRHVFSESLFLTSMATALAFVITSAAGRFIGKRLPGSIATRLVGAEGLAIDYRVLVFTAGLSVVVILLCGIAMAAGSWRPDLVSALQRSSRTSTGSRGISGQVLVSCEIALAIMLIIGAALILKGLWRLERASLGFDPSGVIRVRFEPLIADHPKPSQRLELFKRVIESIKSIPGVDAVGALSPQIFPFSGAVAPISRFLAEKIPDADVRADVLVVNSDYFAAVGSPVLSGRTFSDFDSTTAQPVVVISQELAKRYWGDKNPVGQRIRLKVAGTITPWASIVGVVGSVRRASAMEWQRIVYRPMTQSPPASIAVMIRAPHLDLTPIISTVRSRIKMIDPTAPQYPIVDLQSALSIYWDSPRFTAGLWAAFACFGVLLATLGVYGTLRSWVAGHVVQFGIRLAIGARPRDILLLVMRRSLIICSFGLLGGIAGAFALQKIIVTQIQDVSPTDPWVLISVSGLMVVVALFATWLPARSAARTDPLIAIKQ